MPQILLRTAAALPQIPQTSVRVRNFKRTGGTFGRSVVISVLHYVAHLLPLPALNRIFYAIYVGNWFLIFQSVTKLCANRIRTIWNVCSKSTAPSIYRSKISIADYRQRLTEPHWNVYLNCGDQVMRWLFYILLPTTDSTWACRAQRNLYPRGTASQQHSVHKISCHCARELNSIYYLRYVVRSDALPLRRHLTYRVGWIEIYTYKMNVTSDFWPAADSWCQCHHTTDTIDNYNNALGRRQVIIVTVGTSINTRPTWNMRQ